MSPSSLLMAARRNRLFGRLVRRGLGLAGCAIGLFSAPAALSATTYAEIADEDLVDRAPFVVRAQVESSRSLLEDGMVWTDLVLQIHEALRGDLEAPVILRLPGGKLADGTVLEVAGTPTYRAGTELLVFASADPDGRLRPLHLGLGLFEFRTAGESHLALRDLGTAQRLDRSGRPSTVEDSIRSGRAFEAWVRDRIAGVERPPDYFPVEAQGVPIQIKPGIGARIETTTEPTSTSRFTLDVRQGFNLRWFEFDRDQAVVWQFDRRENEPSNDSFSIFTDGGLSLFDDAISAWNDEVDTPIDLQLEDSIDAGGGAASFDGINSVQFGDPDNVIGTAFDCTSGGVLAVAATWYDLYDRAVFDGRWYLRILGSDIVVNRGVDCYLEAGSCPQADATELLAHEIGHSLGLDHSCGETATCSAAVEDDALLRAVLHGDCRGARLNVDDRSALAALYLPGRRPDGGPGWPTAPPAAPANLTARLDGAELHLSWSDRSPDEIGFRLYRDDRLLARLGNDVTEYVDRSLDSDRLYRYRLVAYNGVGESGPQIRDVLTPPRLPISLEIDQIAPTRPLAGEPIQFTASTSGPVREVRWDFDHDEFGLSTIRCLEQTFCRTHVFTRAGSRRMVARAIGDQGQESVVQFVLDVGSPPGGSMATRSTESIVTGLLRGGRGGRIDFVTDLVIFNPQAHPVVAEMTWTPRGLQPSARVARRMTVDGRETILLRDVVLQTFGVDSGQGAVRVRAITIDPPAEPGGRSAAARSEANLWVRRQTRSDGDLGASPPAARASRSGLLNRRNDQSRSTEFQASSPSDSHEEWLIDDDSSRPVTIAGVPWSEDLETSLVVVNLDDRAGEITFSIRDELGRSLVENQVLTLAPGAMRLRHLTDLRPILDATPVSTGAREGTATAPKILVLDVRSDGIRFLAATRSLDRVSEDEIVLHPQASTAAPRSSSVIVPRLVTGSGAYGFDKRSELFVHNPNAVAVEATFELLARGRGNRQPQTVGRQIAPGQTFYSSDPLRDLFEVESGVAAVRIRWPDNTARPLLSGATTWAETENGLRFGTVVEAQTSSSAATVSFGVRFDLQSRASLGLLNLSPTLVEVLIEVTDPLNRPLARTTVGLAPFQLLERNLAGLIADLAPGQEVTVRASTTSPGQLMSYTVSLDPGGKLRISPGRVDVSSLSQAGSLSHD